MNYFLNNQNLNNGGNFDNKLEIDSLALKLKEEELQNRRNQSEMKKLQAAYSEINEKLEEKDAYVKFLEEKANPI